MSLPSCILFYLAAGGIVNLLRHVLGAVSNAHDISDPDGKTDNFIRWKLFGFLFLVVEIYSVALIFPAICLYLDVKSHARVIDSYHNRIFAFKQRLHNRCSECEQDNAPHPLQDGEWLPGEDF